MQVDYLAHFGDDLMVANAARVSMGKWKNKLDADDEKLIKYLAEHNHITPFFHPQIQFRIEAPIFVARQAFRSTIGTARNEISRRYVDGSPEFFMPKLWRARPDGSIKQGSGGALPEDIENDVYLDVADWYHSANEFYETLLKANVAPELARMILPQAMETMWIETGSLAYWARFYKLRAESSAQLEIQYLANEIGTCIQKLFPVSWPLLIAQRSEH